MIGMGIGTRMNVGAGLEMSASMNQGVDVRSFMRNHGCALAFALA